MKKVKKALSSTGRFICKGKKKIVSVVAVLMVPVATFANTLMENQDVMSALMDTALGKTIAKSGMIWGVLMTVAILVAAGRAAIANDPRKFIPGFIVVGGIAAAVGFIIT